MSALFRGVQCRRVIPIPAPHDADERRHRSPIPYAMPRQYSRMSNLTRAHNHSISVDGEDSNGRDDRDECVALANDATSIAWNGF